MGAFGVHSNLSNRACCSAVPRFAQPYQSSLCRTSFIPSYTCLDQLLAITYPPGPVVDGQISPSDQFLAIDSVSTAPSIGFTTLRTSSVPSYTPEDRVLGDYRYVHRPRRYALLPSGSALYPLTPPKTDSGRSSLCLTHDAGANHRCV